MPKRKNVGCFRTKRKKTKKIEALNIQNNEDLVHSNTETFNCLICMDIRPINYIFQPYNFTNNNPTITLCSHPFCIDCISKYIDAKIQENITIIECPDANCKKEIEFDCCINIIPKLVMDRWEESLSNSLISSSASLYCPFKDCSAALLKAKESSCKKPGVENSTKAECPHCKRYICTKCSVAWHVGMECDAFEKLDDNEKANEDVMLRNLVKEKHWVRCPNCKFYVERIDGCSELICRCRHEFCYDCGLSLYPTTNGCRCRHINTGAFVE